MTEKTTKRVQKKINTEHRDILVNIFQQITIENYAHELNEEYKIMASILKSLPEDYDIEKLKKVLEYYKENGLKDVTNNRGAKGSLMGYLKWAFLYPEEAIKPMYTINLRKETSSEQTPEDKNIRKLISPNSREYYDNLFKTIEESREKGEPIITGFEDEDIPNQEIKLGCDNPDCMEGYVLNKDGTVDYCECYKKQKLITQMKKAGIPNDYFDKEKIDTKDLYTARKVKKNNESILQEIDINETLSKYEKNIERIKNEGWNVVFEGPTGAGKSTAASICGKAALKSGYSVIYIEVQELKKIWTGERITEKLEDIKNRMYDVDFLILDDLGEEYVSNSGHQLSEMDLLFRERVGRTLCTIITTNATEEQLNKRYGERMFSLLKKKNNHIIMHRKFDLRETDNSADFLFE